MLLQYSVENYKSIKTKMTLDMTCLNLKEHSEFTINRNGIPILPIASIYGANASGKSNFIMSYFGFINMIYFSDDFLIKPYLFNEEEKNKPTKFEVFVLINEENGLYEYQYGFSILNGNIQEEYLYKRIFSENASAYDMIFEREAKKIKFGRDIKRNQYKDCVSSKKLFITSLNERNIDGIHEVKYIYKWAMESTSIPMAEITYEANNADFNKILAEVFFSMNIKQDILNFMSEFDPCIEDIQVKLETNILGEVTYCDVYTIHNGYEFRLEDESEGTKKMFVMCVFLIFALKTGKTLFIDELDCKLHSLILRKIIRMFHDKDVNIGNAQLIFTTHNLTLLNSDDLRKDEIWFVGKGKDGNSEMYSLAEFENVDNKYSELSWQYLSGRFGAIPFVR